MYIQITFLLLLLHEFRFNHTQDEQLLQYDY